MPLWRTTRHKESTIARDRSLNNQIKIEDLAVDDQWSCLPASNAYGFWTHVATVDILIASAALYLGDIHLCTWYLTGQQCPVGSSSRWVTARKTYLHCYRTGVTSYLHQTIDLWFDNSCLTYVQNMEPKPYEFTICMVIPILQYHTIRYHSEKQETPDTKQHNVPKLQQWLDFHTCNDII